MHSCYYLIFRSEACNLCLFAGEWTSTKPSSTFCSILFWSLMGCTTTSSQLLIKLMEQYGRIHRSEIKLAS
ncbi:hypothetical protein QYF36_012669 [Acer negundo]|nr:hypothetical protein QYF36_012669 [Acer negundo]